MATNAGGIVVTIETRDTTPVGLKKAELNFRNFGNAVTGVAKASAAAFAGLGIAVAKTTKDFAAFDTSVREITTLLSEVESGAVEALENSIIDLAITTGQSVEKMGKANYDAVSAGFTDASESALLLEQASRLAVAGVADVSETTDVLTSALNSYGVSAKEAAKFSDQLFTIVRLGKTTIPELASGLGKSIAIAPQVAVSFDELGAAVATLTAAGQSTDETLTALTQVMAVLLKPTEALTARLQALGFESGKAIVQAQGFAGAIGTITEAQSEAELAEMFSNIRAIRAILPLAGTQMESFTGNVEEMRDALGATDIAFQKIAEGAGFRFQQLQTRIEVASIKIGEALLPIADAVVSLAESFSELSNSTIANIAKIGVSLTAGIAAVKIASAAVGAFGVTLAAVGGPITLIVGALGAATAAFIALGGISQEVAPSVNTADMALTDITETVKELEDSVGETEKAFAGLTEEIKNLSVEQIQQELAELEKKKINIQVGIDSDIGAQDDFTLPEFKVDLSVPSATVAAIDDLNVNMTTLEDEVTETATAFQNLTDRENALNARLKELTETATDTGEAVKTVATAVNMDFKDALIASTDSTKLLESRIATLGASLTNLQLSAQSELLGGGISEETLEKLNKANTELANLKLLFEQLTGKNFDVQTALTDFFDFEEPVKAAVEAMGKVGEASEEAAQEAEDSFKETTQDLETETEKWAKAVESFGGAAAITVVNTMASVADSVADVFIDSLGHANSVFEKFLADVAKQLTSLTISKGITGLIGLIPGGGIFGALKSFFGASGGIVPGFAGGGFVGTSPVISESSGGITDRVPAVLTPGEAVIPRDSVANNQGIVNQLIESPEPVPASAPAPVVTNANSMNIAFSGFDEASSKRIMGSPEFRHTLQLMINNGEIQLETIDGIQIVAAT